MSANSFTITQILQISDTNVRHYLLSLVLSDLGRSKGPEQIAPLPALNSNIDSTTPTPHGVSSAARTKTASATPLSD